MKPTFSRSSFEASDSADALSNKLSTEITRRMQAATDVESEIAAILAELKEIGQSLYSWDASIDFQVWGDDHIVHSSDKRMIINFIYHQGEPPHAEVTFGPWPKKEASPSCPMCKVEMEAETILFKIQGHGSVKHESLPFSLWFGSDLVVEGRVAGQSINVQRQGWQCKNCHGFWFPSKSAANQAL